MTKSQISYTLPCYEFSELFNPNKTVAQKSADVIMKVNLTSNQIFDAHLLINMMIKVWSSNIIIYYLTWHKNISNLALTKYNTQFIWIFRKVLSMRSESAQVEICSNKGEWGLRCSEKQLFWLLFSPLQQRSQSIKVNPMVWSSCNFHLQIIQ